MCKIFLNDLPNMLKVRPKSKTSNTVQDCYIFKFSNTFACLPITQNVDTNLEIDIQPIINIHLERIDRFLETIQSEIAPQISNVKP